MGNICRLFVNTLQDIYTTQLQQDEDGPRNYVQMLIEQAIDYMSATDNTIHKLEAIAAARVALEYIAESLYESYGGPKPQRVNDQLSKMFRQTKQICGTGITLPR